MQTGYSILNNEASISRSLCYQITISLHWSQIPSILPFVSLSPQSVCLWCEQLTFFNTWKFFVLACSDINVNLCGQVNPNALEHKSEAAGEDPTVPAQTWARDYALTYAIAFKRCRRQDIKMFSCLPYL